MSDFFSTFAAEIKCLKPYAIHFINATAETANKTITYSNTGDTHA